ERFHRAIDEYEYEGGYTTVYPVKVNQQRHVVEEILDYGRPYGVGLEVGSKPELQAVLALTDRTDHIIVCNGYKDEEFMRLALMGQKLGHTVFIVLEKMNEGDKLLKVADQKMVKAAAGVRVKSASAGSGKWVECGGEGSKVGLTAAQLAQMIDKLSAARQLDILRVGHFRLGSQLAD